MDWKTRIPALIFWLALVSSSLGDGNAEKRVVCYYTNWSVYRPGTAKFSPQNINPYLCTHLIYAFGGFTKENTLKPFDKYQDIEKGGYAKFTGLKTYNKNLKTMLAIGGWNEGSSRFSPMVADPKRRKEFVKNSVKFLRQNHFDGLDLDWEYPAFRDGGKPRDRNNYADLVQELREEFERESSKTGRPRLLLSMAVPAGIEYIDKGYDIPRLNDYLDFINLLSYDYHSAFEPAVNHHAPLYPLEEANEYNYDTELTIDYTIEHLLKTGASSEKIVLGIPTYGRSYTLFNEDATEIGAPADGPGEEGDATREKGYLAYYEICDSVGKSDEWEVVQPNPSAMGPYAYRLNQWVGYDDENIVRAKARYVNEKKLGGIMFWSIDNDDFRGKCHGRPYPLIEAAKETLLAEDERSTSGQKTKLSDSRKKSRIQGSGQRIQGNTIGRKLSSGNRRSTTQSPVSRRRKPSSRLNTQSNGRGGANNYNADEEDEEEEANSVKSVEKPRPRSRTKSRSKSRPSTGGRRKQQQSSRRGEEEKEESLSNKLTTPEPPTTPDPGSDFKCEDEGFFSHPRDCKKYFWCLDSGPGGLGIVGHQFTCPSGLVFNKAADSCDYPRNVVCPKTKPSEATVSTTRAPITAATSRTTYLYKPARTTTSKPESDEEYEYYDDEEIADSEEVEEEPRITTSAKPLLYKTISRSRPTTTTTTPVTTTTTETHIAASTRTYKATTERVTSFEDEEDPRVIKELIDLIKKAGGIEQLEKQLNYQEKNSGGNSGTTEENGRSTPATISRSLYERVLNRQATRNAGGFLGSLSTTQSTNGDKSDRTETKNSRTSFVNGPGGAQFEGLDNVPEVKNLRRTNKPQYVTIERHRSPTSESPAEDDEEIDDEVDEDSRDVASSEDQAVSNPPNQRASNRRVTPSYVNIRRPRPSTTTSENDVELKDEDSNVDDAEEDEETVHHRHRVNTQEESSSPKSRYTNTQRFRSTTSRNSEEDQAEEVVSNNDFTTESTTTTTTTTTSPTTTAAPTTPTTTTTTEKLIPTAEEVEETPSSTTAQSSMTPAENISSSVESTTSSIPESTSDSSLRVVENSATEILFTTAAASSSSTGSRPEPFTRGPSIAAVSQPRPFGFPRRGRPTASTSSVAPVTEQSRTKVVSETLRLPTLKELVGYTPTQTESIAEFSSTIGQSSTTLSDKTIDGNALQDEPVDLAVTRDEQKISIKDLANREESGSRDPDDGREKEIFDNDILGSEEIQRRSSSSSLVKATQYREKIDSERSTRRVEVPVRILDDANGEEIAELVILRLPESKLNSAILKPVFRVKVLEQDEKSRNDLARDVIRSVTGSNDISSENELPDDRVTSPRRRRVRINSPPSTDTFGDTGSASEDRPNTAGRPRTRQRIVKARRRTRVQEVASNDSGERTSIGRENGRVTGGEENFGRRESFDAESLSDTDGTTVQPTESSTAIRATTLRGNVTGPSKAPSVIRGFYVTKSSVEASSTPEVITDSSTDSTRYPSANTSDYGSDGTIEKTDLPTQSDETVTPFAEGMSYIADESSTYESIGSTAPEVEGETRISNDLYSMENAGSTVGENLETLTTDVISTTDDRSTESGPSAATITEGETSELPEVTTFRPLTSSEVETTPWTTSVEVTTIVYLNDSSSEAIVEESDPTTDHPSESLKTSENSHYGDSPNSLVKTATVLTTVESDDNHERTASELQTERSHKRTTTSIEKTTTRKGTLQRGRVRFTNASKPETSKLSSPDHQRITTKTTRGESDRKIGSTTETYEKTPEQGSTPTTGSLQTSSLRRRDHRRRTTTSLSIDDSTTGSLPRNDNSSASSTESYERAVEYSSKTSSAETTGSSPTSRSFSRRKDHPRRTTTTDRSTLTSTSTQASDETELYTSSDEVQKTGTNFVDTTRSVQRTSQSDDARRTTVALQDSDDFTIDSTTGSDSTTTSTETSEETADYPSTTSEADYLSTNFVGTTGSRFYGRTLTEGTETVATTTESFDKMTETSEPTNTVRVTDNSEEEVQTESTQSIGTTLNFAETTVAWSYLQRNRVTGSASVGKTETLDTSNDVTLDGKTDTFSPTTEVYLTTDRKELNTVTETEDSGTKINDEYGISTEAFERTTETITSPETEATKQLISATTPFITTNDKYDEVTTIISSQTKNDNIVKSTDEESSSTFRKFVDEKSTTASRDEKSTTASRGEKSTTASRGEKGTTTSRGEKSTTASSVEKNTSPSRNENSSSTSRDEQKNYSTVDSSTNTIAPVTQHHEIKRTRGRVRFTNFAAHADETGRNRRPVKQVVVRRRPVTESNNRHRDVDASSDTSLENETPRSSRHPNGRSAEETKNLVELHEQFDEKQNSTNVNVRLVEKKNDKKDSAKVNSRSAAGKRNSAIPNDRSVEEKRYSSSANDRSAEKASSADPSDRSAENKNSADPNDRSVEEKKYSSRTKNRSAENENSLRVNDRSTEKTLSADPSDRSVENKNSADPNDRSVEEKKYSSKTKNRLTENENSSRVNDRSIEKTLSADPSDRSDDNKNSADPNDRSVEEKKYSSRTKIQSTENENSSRVNDRSAENKNSADPNDRSVEEKNYSSQANDRLADDDKNRTKPMRRRVIVYRGRPRPEIVTSTTTMQSLRVSNEDIPNDVGRTRRRMWRKRVVLKRERTAEADDQSIAETVDFRRAMIDDSIGDFREIGSTIEDPELASSAEHADEDNGGEANSYKSSGGFLRRPGSLVRGQGNNRSKTKTQSNSDSINLPVGQPSVFSKIQPIVAAQEIKGDDQSSRAQELAVTLADPPIVVSSATTGRLPFRTTSGPRKISTTIAPRTESPATSRTTPLVRRRQRPSNERIVEIVTSRPRRPAIIDYDYYVDDDDVRLVVKPELKDKLFVTRKGGIRCLDQGNFAHPTSCKKFITCARMVNGQVVGTEYTCPDKLSFDPVGGICNWSAGLGCEDNKKP